MTALKSDIDEETKRSIATSQSKHAPSEDHTKESEISGTTRLPGPEPQITMLSEALENANTAVSFDHAQDFEAAAIAYQETCRLLRQVMRVSSGAEDKRKLQVIQTTYAYRIEELLKHEEAISAFGDENSRDGPSNDGSRDRNTQLVVINEGLRQIWRIGY